MRQAILVYAVALIGACSGSKDPDSTGDIGGTPAVSIRVPTDGELQSPTETTTVEALLSDDSTAVTSLIVEIESDVGGLIDHEGSIDETGIFSAEVMLGSGIQVLTVRAIDEDGLTGSDTVEIPVNGRPEAPVVTISPEMPAIGGALTASIEIDSVDPEDDELEYAWSWAMQETEAEPETSVPVDTPEIGEGVTQRGQVWTVTAVPSDSYGEGPSASFSVMVGNGPPSVEFAVLSPDPATTVDDITATVTGWDDPDNDPEGYTYSWAVNGVTIEDALTETLESDHHAKGDEVVVQVTPVDGFTAGAPVTSEALTIQNSAPEALTVTLSPFAPSTTDDLLATPLGWTDDDDDGEEYTYQWFVDGSEEPSITTDLFPADLTSHFQEIYVVATPTDGEDDGLPITSGTVLIGNTPPALLNVTLSPTSPKTNDPITASVSGWSDLDGDTEGYSYQWSINGLDAAGDVSTIAPSLTTRGDEVQCTVTPMDGTDEGMPVTSDPVVVVNTAPSIATATISPSTAFAGDTLTCGSLLFSDDDDDAPADFGYEWLVNDVSVGSSPTLMGLFTGGQTVKCRVTPSDGMDEGATVETSIVISNTAPEISNVTISPTPAYAADTLTCTPSGYTDIDGDPEGYFYSWEINGSPAGSDTSTLTGGFSDDDDVSCTVTPSDGDSIGGPLTETIEISNSAPSVSSVSIPETDPSFDETLTCIYTGFEDDDGDIDSSTIAWFVNGTDTGETGASLAGGMGFFTGGDSVHCTVTPNDGKDEGTPVESSPVGIDNTPPVLESVTLTPGEAYVESTLTCTPGTTTDIDGTTEFTYTYAWNVNGVPIEATTSTLAAPFFSAAQTVICWATPRDWAEDGVAVESNVVTIRNTAPQITEVEIFPEFVQTNDTVESSVETFDADGEGVVLNYQWRVNGTIVLEGPTTTTLNGVAYFNKNDEIQLDVTPSDLAEYGPTIASTTIMVENTAPGDPVIDVLPATPQPEDDLMCVILVDSIDSDDDLLSYTYRWFNNDVETAHTSATISSSLTQHADRWECEATANDDEESGGFSIDSVVVNDMTNPDPPVFDDMSHHTNDDSKILTGDCEADCVIDLYCNEGIDTYETLCNEFGRFSQDVTLPRGIEIDCWGTCTDIAGNESGASPAHAIESCDPWDEREDDAGSGDTPGDVFDEWGIISDDGGSEILISGNVLDDDDDDWFVISAGDDVAADIAAGIDYFNFNVELTAGTADYRFIVHRGGTGAGDAECSVDVGYTEYNWFVQDDGGTAHSSPADTRQCGNPSDPTLSECQDNSEEFYIHVYREGSSVMSCQNYNLKITNGDW